MLKKIVFFILLLFSILIPLLGFEIINKIPMKGFNSFYLCCAFGVIYIILLLSAAITILKTNYKSIYKIFFVAFDCIYIFLTYQLMTIMVP